MKIFMYIFAIIFVISFIAGLFDDYHHCLAMALISLLITILLLYNIYEVNDNITVFNKCPYSKNKCKTDLTINCDQCLEYNNGIVASKF
jgi:hypothetical protein